MSGVRFYLMASAHARGALHLDTADSIDDDEWALAQGLLQPRTPLVFHAVEGSRPTDFIGTTYPAIVLVSDRVVRTLKESRFTGWKTYSVKAHDAKRKVLSGYQGLAVTGRCGPIDEARAERAILKPPPGGQAIVGRRGFPLDLDTWDGSDLFMPEGTTLIVVVEPVKKALKKVGATNVRLEDLSRVEWFD